MKNSYKLIILFLLISLVVPFYESKRVIRWGIESETKKENFFRSLVLCYAKKAEEIKKYFNLENFFEKENNFWLEFKKSPLLFKQEILTEEFDGLEQFRKKSEEAEKQEKTDNDFSDASQEPQELKEPKENQKPKPDPQKPEPKPEEPKIIPKIDSPFRVLIIGDSFIAVSGGVGEILERELLKYKDTAVARRGKVSSGLSRPDYFNWQAEAERIVSQYNFNIAVVMIGSNDAQSITDLNGNCLFNYRDLGWNQKYSERVNFILNLFKENKITVFWIGFPVMRGSVYSQKISNLNSIYEKECRKYENVYFIPTWNLLAGPDGKYTAYLPDESGKHKLARQSDGIHLTYFGGTIVVKKTTEKMEEVLKLEKK